MEFKTKLLGTSALLTSAASYAAAVNWTEITTLVTESAPVITAIGVVIIALIPIF